jgi:hypothetical protein
MPGTNLPTQNAVLTTRGTSKAIPLGGGTLTGMVVLNGATLPFVVLAPAHKRTRSTIPRAVARCPATDKLDR